jgi:hypothetical protein
MSLLMHYPYVPDSPHFLRFDVPSGQHRVRVWTRAVIGAAGPFDSTGDSFIQPPLKGFRTLRVEFELLTPAPTGPSRSEALIVQTPGDRYRWPLLNKRRAAIATFRAAKLEGEAVVRLIRLDDATLAFGVKQ